DWQSLARIALELVRTTVSVLPLDIASHWLDLVPADRRGAPEFVLLAAAIRSAKDFTDATVDAMIDASADAFHERRDSDGEVVALALGTVAARARCDIGRLLLVAGRAAAVPGGETEPVVRLVSRAIAAVTAEMRGEPELALESFGDAPLEDVPAALALA